jgi:hypothetical protein
MDRKEAMEKTKHHFIKYASNNGYKIKSILPLPISVATAILMLNKEYEQTSDNEEQAKLNCLMLYLDLTLLLIEAWCIDKNIDVIDFGFNTLYDYAQTLKVKSPQENKLQNPFDSLLTKLEESFEKEEEIKKGKDN